jgi:hypothetical protein
MSINYPSGLDTFPPLVDNTDDILALHPNDRGDAIEQLEIKIGVNSSAVVTTIDYFLKHASGAYRNHTHDGTSDDGAQLDWDTCFADAVHSHASAGEGGTLDWDVCWADAVHSHASAGEGGQIDLTNGVTGVLPLVNGGTNSALGIVVENKTSDPVSPVTGQIWIRTDI